jgi:hypothetical protein
MGKNDYSDRITQPNPDKPELSPDIFRLNNGSMGLSAGFVDFATSQVKNDVFGTSPWLSANPEGSSDRDLANLITKHSQWKFNQTSLQESLLDAIRVTCWGGTSFVKARWEKQSETIHKKVSAAWSLSQDAFLMGLDGGYVLEMATLKQLQVDGADIEWRDTYLEEAAVIYDNLRSSLLDFRDIAFDEKAPELDLNFTDLFTRFRCGLLDAVSFYGIPEEHIDELRNALADPDEEVRGEDGESSTTTKRPGYDDDEANPEITLIEGFIRVNALGANKAPARIHVIFSEKLNMLFKADYLANITPSGQLPIYPIRIHKQPRRIFGCGYFEKYEQDNDAVDRHHNSTVHRNGLSSNVVCAFQPEALLDKGEGMDGVVDISTPFVLAEGKTINDLISFAVIPDANNRSIELLNQRMQMAQMRSGITSAAQGELKGVPQASTATGVMQIQSRGALLLKEQVDQASTDLEKYVEYCVHLNYANLDHDEVFAWGEGLEQELHTIKPNDVMGLRMNVSLTLVQAQNQSKFQSAQAGIDVALKYAQIPEHEKNTQRPLFVEALTMLGFNDAKDIIRPAVVDVASLLQLLPPEQAQPAANALAQAGLIQLEPQLDESEAITGAGNAPVAEPQQSP